MKDNINFHLGKGANKKAADSFYQKFSNFIIENMTLQNSHDFHIIFFNTENITINNTNILAPEWWENTDAIDPIMTTTGNTISCGNDHIAIKSVLNDSNTHDFYIARNKFLEGHRLPICPEALRDP